MLREEFLNPMGLTQQQLADGIHVPYQRVNELINGKRGVTPSTALRLARFFGNSADFWMNLQMRWDIYFTSGPRQMNSIQSSRSWSSRPLATLFPAVPCCASTLDLVSKQWHQRLHRQTRGKQNQRFVSPLACNGSKFNETRSCARNTTQPQR